jgi:rubredoxin
LAPRWPTHKVTFEVPDIEAMSDEDLRLAFPLRDGRWSALICEALTAPDVACLDLNAPWAETPQSWSCPCCHRDKRALLRVSRTGVLMAHLHRHHDHLHEYIAHRLQARFGMEWTKGIPAGTYHLEHMGSQMIERFSPTVICQDCNGADAAAKRALSQIDRYFSFRPDEIRRFITPVANQAHTVDMDLALAIWLEQAADFAPRVAFGASIVEVVAAGQLIRTRGAEGSNPTSASGQYALDWLYRDETASRRLRADIAALEGRSISRDGAGRKAARSRGDAPAPTDAELATYDGGRYPEVWAGLPKRWRCPGCARDRRGILRRSSNGRRRWSGFVQRHRQYVWSLPQPAETTVKPMIIGHDDMVICDSCGVLGALLKQRRPEFAGRPYTLQLSEIMAVISVSPNALHEVDLDALAEAAEAAAGRVEEERAYGRFLDYILAPRKTYAYFLDLLGDARTAWRKTVDRYHDGLDGKTWSQTDERLRKLLRDAETYQPLPLEHELPEPPR